IEADLGLFIGVINTLVIHIKGQNTPFLKRRKFLKLIFFENSLLKVGEIMVKNRDFRTIVSADLTTEAQRRHRGH
ncbi:MAG: hypothetical protein ABIN13_10005, partial [Mucilaginibacter sp.]